MALPTELSVAIRRYEITVEYQPIISLATRHCVGAEALLRWRQRDGTNVSPEVFVALAEQHGLIDRLTDMMIETVIADLNLMLAHRQGIHIAINISATDMQSGRFLTILEAKMRGTAIKPFHIWLEATERSFIDADQARSTILQARESGYRVAIDDFGTGYSSLSLLEKLPINALKIDKSFVDAIGMDAATSVVIPYTVNMAHSLQLDIVAEGIETPQQEEYLSKLGVQFAQGWLFSKSLTAAEFIVFLDRQGARLQFAADEAPCSEGEQNHW